MTTPKEIQLAFLQKVKSSIPSNISMVDEIAELLSTSNDSAYRRMRGETLLSIDEIARICAHFRVPFESNTFTNSDNVTFNYKRMRNQTDGFHKWIHAMHENLQIIGRAPENEILYTANDAPIWHHFHNDELIAFKVFYWQKTILNAPELEGQPFDASLINQDHIDTAKQLLNTYNNIRSTEIWTEDTLNSTLKQIEYFWESGFFKNKDEALRMCDHIREELHLIQQKAELNSKCIGHGEDRRENFTLYQSEVMVGNNSILATIGTQKIAYLSYNTFNILWTQDSDYLIETELWIKNLIRKSILISGVNEKQRHRFFKTLHSKVDLLQSQMK